MGDVCSEHDELYAAELEGRVLAQHELADGECELASERNEAPVVVLRLELIVKLRVPLPKFVTIWIILLCCGTGTHFQSYFSATCNASRED